MSKLLVVPSAKPVPLELQVEFGPISSGMIPVQSRPIIDYVIRKFAPDGFRALVGTAKDEEAILDYLALNPDLAAETVNVGETSSLGETIFRMLCSVAEEPDLVVINLADTLVSEPLPLREFVCYAEREDTYRWTTFRYSDEGMFDLKEKGHFQSSGEAAKAFVGIFAIEGIKRFTEILAKELREAPEHPLDPFYRALAVYFNQRIQETGRAATAFFARAVDWWDFGHLDTYYRSKCSLTSNARYFNDVKVDIVRGTVIKRSANTAKLVRELTWYLKLPPELQHVAPRVLSHDTAPERAFVEMEFYGYIPLNDLFLYGDCDLGVWEMAFAAIRTILDEFAKHAIVPKDRQTAKNALVEMYEGKTLSRLKAMSGVQGFEPFFDPTLTINGRKIWGLSRIVEELPGILRASGLYEIDVLPVIHGDLCFSNILFDRRHGIVRVVDPRGDFGGFDVHGDFRYDLAKLSHSASGFYDLLVNGLFSLETNDSGRHIELRMRARDRHYKVRDYFHLWLSRHWGALSSQVALIESLLFLSMGPLHSDNPRRQRAFLAQGLMLMDHYIHEKEAP